MDFDKELAYHTPETWAKDETTCNERLKDDGFWNSVICGMILLFYSFFGICVCVDSADKRCKHAVS